MRGICGIALIILASMPAACGDNRTITAYPLEKAKAANNDDREWLLLNPTTFRVNGKTVVSETVGMVSEFEECTVLSPRDWMCIYSDRSGSFGFREAQFANRRRGLVIAASRQALGDGWSPSSMRWNDLR